MQFWAYRRDKKPCTQTPCMLCWVLWGFTSATQLGILAIKVKHAVTKARQGCNRQTSLYVSSPFSAVCFLPQEELLVCGWGVSSFTTPQLSSLTDSYQSDVATLCALGVTLRKGHIAGAANNWVTSNYIHFSLCGRYRLTEFSYLSSLLRSTA